MYEIEQQRVIAVIEDVYHCKVISMCPCMKGYTDGENYALRCEYKERARQRREQARMHGEKQLVCVTCPYDDSKCYVVKDLKEK